MTKNIIEGQNDGWFQESFYKAGPYITFVSEISTVSMLVVPKVYVLGSLAIGAATPTLAAVAAITVPLAMFTALTSTASFILDPANRSVSLSGLFAATILLVPLRSNPILITAGGAIILGSINWMTGQKDNSASEAAVDSAYYFYGTEVSVSVAKLVDSTRFGGGVVGGLAKAGSQVFIRVTLAEGCTRFKGFLFSKDVGEPELRATQIPSAAKYSTKGIINVVKSLTPHEFHSSIGFWGNLIAGTFQGIAKVATSTKELSVPAMISTVAFQAIRVTGERNFDYHTDTIPGDPHPLFERYPEQPAAETAIYQVGDCWLYSEIKKGLANWLSNIATKLADHSDLPSTEEVSNALVICSNGVIPRSAPTEFQLICHQNTSNETVCYMSELGEAAASGSVNTVAAGVVQYDGVVAGEL